MNRAGKTWEKAPKARGMAYLAGIVFVMVTLIGIFAQPRQGWVAARGEPLTLSTSGPLPAACEGSGPVVAMDGNTLVAGFPSSDGSGTVHVYGRTGDQNAWRHLAVLSASAGREGDGFGHSVAIRGGTIVVGAPFHRTADGKVGAAYVFTRPENGWSGTRSETTLLSATGAEQGSRFGWAVGLSGDRIFVGAPGQGKSHGAVYVFTRPEDGWEGNLGYGVPMRNEKVQTGDFFGASLAVQGNILAVGAPGTSEARGGAYVTYLPASSLANGMEMDSTTPWRYVGAPWGNPGDQLGWSLALDEAGQLFCGAPHAGAEPQKSTGLVYVFSGETMVSVLSAPEGSAGDLLGWAVAAVNGRVAAGAPGARDGQGLVYLFANHDGQWENPEFPAVSCLVRDGAWGELLGASVALGPETLAAAAPCSKSDAGEDYGRVFLFADLTQREAASGAGLTLTESGWLERKQVGLANSAPQSGAPAAASAQANVSKNALKTADDQKVNLTLSVSPANAGSTNPTGTSSFSLGQPLVIEAKAALGWQFVKWTVVSGEMELSDATSAKAAVVLKSDGELRAQFAPGGTFSLTTTTYPTSAGSISPTGTTQWNLGDIVEISATPASTKYIFYKWECSSGCEVQEPFKDKSVLRIAQGAAPGSVSLIAHFLSLDTSTGSATFTASHDEKIGNTHIDAGNQASVHLRMKNALSGLTLDKATTFTALFNSGMAISSHTISDDPRSVVGKDSGSAFFTERGTGTGRVEAKAHLAWQKGILSLDYYVLPSAGFNVLDLKSSVYGKGKGKWLPIKASDTDMGGMPTVLSVESSGWAMVCISPEGLDFSGKGKSTTFRQLRNDLVTWSVKGSGTLKVYKWIQPVGTADKTAANGTIRKDATPSLALGSEAGRLRGASDRQGAAAGDPGMLTNFSISGSLIGLAAPPRDTRAPFFFEGKIYAVSRPFNPTAETKNLAVLSMGSLSATGKYNYEASFTKPVGNAVSAPFAESRGWTSCVFNGQAYIFYGIRNSDDTKFNIYASSSHAPSADWNDLGWVSIGGEQVYGVKNAGAESVMPLKAVVFNGRIYLVFTASNGSFTFISSANGSDWEYGGAINDAWSWGDRFGQNFSACAVMKDGVPVLCVVIMGTQHYKDWCYFRYISQDNKLVGGTHQYLDWVSIDHAVAISAGTIANDIQGSAVQVFAQNSGWIPLGWPARRMTLNVDSNQVQGWMDIPNASGRSTNAYVTCDSVEASVAVGTYNVRKYIVFFNTTYSSPSAEYVAATSYESNYYKGGATLRSFNTAIPENNAKSSWTLLGVIEGVPPFVRNGSKGTSSLSDVQYGRNTARAAGADLKAECELFGLLGLKLKLDNYGITAGASFKNVLSTATGFTRTVKTYSSMSWEGTGTEKEGKYGYLLYSKPTIISRDCDEYSQNSTAKIAAFVILGISDVTIEAVPYELASPPQGMAKRAPTTNLTWWKNERPPLPQFDPMAFNFHSGHIQATDNQPAECSWTSEYSGYAKISNKLTLEAKGALDLGLVIEGKFNLKAEIGGSISQSMAETLRSRLSKIPEVSDGTENGIHELDIDAAWYEPVPGYVFKGGASTVADWIPSENRNQLLVPWCLTWKVRDYH